MTVSFGRFTLDDQTRRLAEDGRAVHLSPKAFDLLLLLVERRPAVVSKGEIASRIWPGVSVSETSLGGLVKEIRRALADDAAQPAAIRTVHRVGYAFIAPVEGDADRPAPDPSAYRCWLAWDDRTFSLRPGDNVIGRDPRSTVWIDRADVSRRHARIVVGPVEATIEDLGSRNGTAVGRQPVSTARRLEEGDSIRLGATTMTFRQWSDALARPTEPLGPSARRTGRR